MNNLANTQLGANCVSKEFWLLANTGIVVCLVSAFLYFMQSRKGMFEIMRPYVILGNLITLAWFILLQYYRFKPSGRACSGDFGATEGTQIRRSGQILLGYIVSQYIFYMMQKCVSICITNRHETELEERKKLILEKV